MPLPAESSHWPLNGDPGRRMTEVERVALVLERVELWLFFLFLSLWPYRDSEGALLLPDQRSHPWGPSPQEDMANFQVLVKLLPVMVTLVPYWMVYFQVGTPPSDLGPGIPAPHRLSLCCECLQHYLPRVMLCM